VLRRWRRRRAEGRAEEKAEVLTTLVKDLVEEQFGSLSKWARVRVEKAEPAQLEHGLKKVLRVGLINWQRETRRTTVRPRQNVKLLTLDEVVGKR
jgi:hypothetical protein